MIARPIGVGWQTILADLSLILFMVTASALADAPDGPFADDKGGDGRATAPATRPAPPPPSPPMTAAPRAEPVGVWRAGAGAPPLLRWLDDVDRDPRLRLTITVHFEPGGRGPALDAARRLIEAAGTHGRDARILIEPGSPAGASVAIGYDADPAGPAIPAAPRAVARTGTVLAQPAA